MDANLRERLREAQRAESMVEREVAKFLARLSDLEVVADHRLAVESAREAVPR